MAGDAWANAWARHLPSAASRPLLPWETPGLALIFGSGPITTMLQDPAAVPLPRAPPLPMVGQVKRKEPEDLEESAPRGPAALRRPTVPLRNEEDERTAVLKVWMGIVRVILGGSTVGQQLGDLTEEGAMEILRNVFALKATGTLARRATAWTLAGKWASQFVGSPSFSPLSEGLVYTYIEDLRVTGAPPTRAQSFIEALHFVKGTVGMDYDAAEVISPRVRGAAFRSWELKRITVKATPLSVVFITALEEYLCDVANDLVLREAAGFILFTVFSRSRAGDAARITKEPAIDPGDDEGEYLETVAFRGKSIRGMRNPVVLDLLK